MCRAPLKDAALSNRKSLKPAAAMNRANVALRSAINPALEGPADRAAFIVAAASVRYPLRLLDELAGPSGWR